ncbi:MAG: hypothetical protein ACK58Z_06720, partial [Pseudanabaena sp.]
AGFMNVMLLPRSFEKKKSVPLRVLIFNFAYGKMKTAIAKYCNDRKGSALRSLFVDFLIMFLQSKN